MTAKKSNLSRIARKATGLIYRTLAATSKYWSHKTVNGPPGGATRFLQCHTTSFHAFISLTLPLQSASGDAFAMFSMQGITDPRRPRIAIAQTGCQSGIGSSGQHDISPGR